MVVDLIDDEYAIKLDRPFSQYTELYEQRWLKDGGIESNDTSFYNEIEYIGLVLDCFRAPTLGHARGVVDFLKNWTLFTPDSIFDFGAGIGFTSLLFAEAFPRTTVLYNNLEGPQMTIFAQLLADLKVPNIEMVTGIHAAEVVVGLEIIEHFQNVDEIVRLAIDNENVKLYFDSSSFASEAPGHYATYNFAGGPVSNQRAKRKFNDLLEQLGFVRSQSIGSKRYFNGRPTIFIHQDAIREVKTIA
jgi:hypothetical protein